MHIRPKTKRRLLILLAIMVVVVGILSIFYISANHRQASDLAKLRAEAMTAYRAGEYDKTVHLLRDYRDKSGAEELDPEAQFAWAKSLVNVPIPQKNIYDAMHAFEVYLEKMKPGDTAAQRELLRLYVGTAYNVEAVRIADDLLAKNPADAEVLQQKAFALTGQHKPEEALVVCKKLNEVAPLNLNGQIFTLLVMSQLHAPAQELIDYAEGIRKAHDKDPRFEMLLSMAYSQGKQKEQQTKWLKSAAERTPPDAMFVAQLVSQLDMTGLYSDASKYLETAAAKLPDPMVQHLQAQRLWQDGKIVELQDRLKQQDPASAAADGVLLGYRALGLYAGNKTAEARALVDAMSRRKDPTSWAWATGLAAKFASPPLSATERIIRLQQAVGRDPQNPVLHTLLAEAYLQTGEDEHAIQQCGQALQLSRGWATPYVIAVRALIAGRRPREALANAEEGLQRAPGRHDTLTAMANARFACARESGLAREYVELIPLLEELQKGSNDASTVPMYVTALARAGRREQASAAVKNALAIEPPLSASALAVLAQAAEEEKLEVAKDVRAFAQKVHGLTLEIALSQARALLDSGDGAGGLKLMLDAARGHEAELPWRIAIAEYREASGQGDALKDWIAMGDQSPGEMILQQTILHSPSRFRDRDFWARTINRLKTLTGEQGLPWRIEQSRWLLSGELTERDKAEAVNLLTQITHEAPAQAEPHHLLAIAMEKVENIPGAISEMTAAADAHPGDPIITRDLVHLLEANNHAADAQAYLDKLAENPHLPLQFRYWLVQTYADHGANDKAIALLVKDEPAGSSVDRDRMLVQLYRRAGRGDDAAKLYTGLLDKPIAEAAFWDEAADFFAARHDMPKANHFLARLGDLKLQPGELELNHAQFAEKWLTADEALKEYQQAVKAAPTIAPSWGSLGGFQMRHQHFAEAIKAADEGLKVAPGNPALQALRSDAVSLAGLGDPTEFQPLIEVLCRTPQDPGAMEMLAAIVASHNAKIPPAAAAQKIGEIADRYPQNLLLQLQVIHSLADAGQTDAALEVARRSTTAYPNRPEPQAQLAGIYADTGDWAKAEQAALLWRKNSPDQPMAADLALARIYLQQSKKDPAGAARILAPYMGETTGVRNTSALELYVKALVLMDRSSEAATLLKPLVQDSADWRAKWLELAPLQKDAPSGSKWIAEVAPLITDDALSEHLALASAWYGIGTRFESSEALESASHALEPLLAEGKESTKAWILAGLIASARSDYPAAEKSYRQVLKIDAHMPEGLNDLAYVLWLKGEDQNLVEARKLAESAIAARPQTASFYDTLARIQARAGDQKAAAQNFRNALTKDPNSLEAKIGLADLLARDPSTRKQARELLSQIQGTVDATPHLPSVLKKQYQNARDAVASSL